MALRLIGGATYTMTRTADGYWAESGDDAGTWVDGAATVGTVYGSLQPISDRDLQRMPEGARERARFYLFTAPGSLRTSDVSAKTPPDRVTCSGVEYVVTAVEEWPVGAQPYQRATLSFPEGA